VARALRVEYLTVGWNVVEGLVAITAALAAGSVALLGFGIDSFVESASGSALVWRLLAERRATDEDRIEQVEQRARRLVAASLILLAAYMREAMTIRAELDLASYDRLFPAQDFMPNGSFGNLIALPLHGESRRRGTTVFLDPATLEPFEDQWAFLSSLGRSSRASVESFVDSVREVAAGPDGRTYRAPHGQPVRKPPETMAAETGAMLS
jgi:hypothetical protein